MKSPLIAIFLAAVLMVQPTLSGFLQLNEEVPTQEIEELNQRYLE